ncbi:MAG TPA: NAD(+) diphosphatase [Nocardioidaceae bacterium]
MPDDDGSSQPEIALSVRGHDRVGHRRTDEAWLAETWADPATRVLPLARGHFPVDPDGTTVAWTSPEDAPEGQRVFLGEQGGVARFAVLVDEAPPDGWANLRLIGPSLSRADASLLVHAVALAEWHRGHRFCPRCGGRLDTAAAGHVLTCRGCGRQQFPRTDPAVIMLVTDGDGRALLGRQPRWPEGRYSTLAGFVDPGESLEDAVRREVAEEVGIEIGRVSYLGNQPWPFPASLMVGFFAEAHTTEIHVDGDEISQARWFTRDGMHAEAEAGTLLLPGAVSISRTLIETWYGGPLPGHW